MNQHTTAALCALLGTVLLNSCSSSLVPAGMFPTDEDRLATVAKFRDQWTHSESVENYGLGRSVMIIEQAPSKKLKVRPQGMAVLISADGYALTANHVVPAGFRPRIVTGKDGSIRDPVHISPAKATLTDADGKVKQEFHIPGVWTFSIYGEGIKNRVSRKTLKASPVRVVKRFPTVDLALVKTGLRPRQFFTLSDVPEKGTVLFASGIPFRSSPSSAGVVIRRSSRGSEIHSLHTTLPLGPGDSGGPVFDSQGSLAGVATNGFPRALLIFPPSIIRRIDTTVLADSMAQDRSRKSAAAKKD